MLPGRHSLSDGPQRSVSGLFPAQVRAPAIVRPGSTEVCLLQPDNDDAVGPLQPWRWPSTRYQRASLSPRCALLPLFAQAPLRSACFGLTMTMLPARYSFLDGPQRSVSGLCPARVRAPATFRPGSSEVCLLRPDNDDAAGPL
jgi:hypothetical protein